MENQWEEAKGIFGEEEEKKEVKEKKREPKKEEGRKHVEKQKRGERKSDIKVRYETSEEKEYVDILTLASGIENEKVKKQTEQCFSENQEIYFERGEGMAYWQLPKDMG